MMNIYTPTLALVLATAALVAGLTPQDALARKKSIVEQAVTAIESRHTFEVPAAGSIEVAFSPDEGSEHLVIKAIDSARSEIRMLSYSFTSYPVTQALLRAKKRGVDVALVADYKDNVETTAAKKGRREGNKAKSMAALSALASAGIDVRTIHVYPIHHDKVIVVDAETVELGSFNYSDAAAHRNSENALVNWRNPALAKVYLQHFERNYKQSTPFQLQY